MNPRPTQRAPKITRPSSDRCSGQRLLALSGMDWLSMTARDGESVVTLNMSVIAMLWLA